MNSSNHCINAITANKIKFVAEIAHEDCALTTLKNAKEQITQHTKIFAGYERQWAGIDRAEVLEAFTQAMECTRKADFSRRLELLIETMTNIITHEARSACQ
ncbi:hypothetical protein GTR05_004558 [Salmonella enterica]|nr:hypothetical protein [Salmonella enterica]EDZ3590759.1 hypothetical protein [Salmonella enterica subsp. enterica serovar Wagenia]